jgi:hypothetical protein
VHAVEEGPEQLAEANHVGPYSKVFGLVFCKSLTIILQSLQQVAYILSFVEVNSPRCPDVVVEPLEDPLVVAKAPIVVQLHKSESDLFNLDI